MKALTAIALALVILGTASQAMADKYRVYCSNGKIEIDTRTPQQMKSARGGNTYMMSEFNYRTDAEKFAKQLGGVGKQCPRR